VPPKVVLALTPQPISASSAKVSLGYTFNSVVIDAHLLHFKPIFDPLLKNVVRVAPVFAGECPSANWSFSSACKNLGALHLLGAEIWSVEKCVFGGYNSTTKSPISLDETSPNLFRLTQEESLSKE